MGKMKHKHTWWEISFYLSLLIIILWLILKLTGLINTPPFIEYGIPIFSATYAFFALYRDFLDRINRIGNGLTRAFMKIEHLENEVGSIKEEVMVMNKSKK